MAKTDRQLDARMTAVVNVEESIARVKNKYSGKLLFAVCYILFIILSRTVTLPFIPKRCLDRATGVTCRQTWRARCILLDGEIVPEITKDSPVWLVALQTVREPCLLREEARFRTSVRQFVSCLVDSGWSHRISAVMRARRPLHKTAHRVSLDVSRSNRVAKLLYTVRLLKPR